MVPGEFGVAGTAVGGDACVAGVPAAGAGDPFTGGRLRGVGAGSSLGSGKLVTVSASPASHPPAGGSESNFFCGVVCVCAVVLTIGARGAAAGATAGARGVIGFPTGTGGA